MNLLMAITCIITFLLMAFFIVLILMVLKVDREIAREMKKYEEDRKVITIDDLIN